MHPSAISASDSRMFRALLLLSGHRLADFSVEACDDEQVQVRGPHGTATYPSGCWISAVGKHLYQGLFSEVCGAEPFGGRPVRHEDATPMAGGATRACSGMEATADCPP